MKPILVQMSDKQWTLQAVHLACALARSNQTTIILLRLMPARHPGYLGTEFGDTPPTDEEHKEIDEYAATAEDYGVAMCLQPMQYVNRLEAVSDAADQLDTAIVFAHIPPGRIPYWHRFQRWNLKRQLSAAHRQLFTLDQQTDRPDSIPAVIITPSPVRSKS